MSTREQWLSIAERCETATGPDRDIDALIFRALSGSTDHWHVSAGMAMTDANCPAVTESLDAITALVERELPGWVWQTNSLKPHSKTTICWVHSGSQHDKLHQGRAATPVLALCAAFCRAMAKKEALK